jgi:hypothetical protein
MFDRKDILEEQILRENIRKAIRIIKNRRLNEEKITRTIVRSLLEEAKQFKYPITALNQLAHLVGEQIWNNDSKSNLTFKDMYTDIASNKRDRDEYVKWILHFSNIDFDTIDADVSPGEIEAEPEEVTSEEEPDILTVSLDDLERNGGDITMEPESQEDVLGEDAPEVEQEEEESIGIKKMAEDAYAKIGPVLRRYYPNPDSPLESSVEVDGVVYPPGEKTERWIFRVYYEKNVNLAADKYEEEYFDPSPDSISDSGFDEEPSSEEADFDLGL